MRFVPYCEDHETPGFLGMFAGITLHDSKQVKVSTRYRSQQQVEAILAHELEHVKGAERGTDYPSLGLKCGGCIGNFFTSVLEEFTEWQREQARKAQLKAAKMVSRPKCLVCGEKVGRCKMRKPK